MNSTTRTRWIGLASLVIAAAGATCGLSIADIREDAGVAGDSGYQDPYATLPNTLVLSAVVRDFKWPAQGGHPDFERVPTSGYGHYVKQVRDTLDAAGKPVFNSAGYKVSVQAKNAAGLQIMPVGMSHIDAMQGDTAATVATSTGGSITTAEAFAQWYRDTPGVNLAKTISITLNRTPGTNMYTFSDKLDSGYAAMGGFFPVNGDLWGNPAGQSKNFGFTCELDTKFVYKKGAGQTFSFTGDDDVWVFIDKKLVVDIGGVHAAVNQSIDLDRLNWLEDGKTYSFKLFFAERHTTQSNVRIDTTINLQAAELPASTGLFD